MLERARAASAIVGRSHAVVRRGGVLCAPMRARHRRRRASVTSADVVTSLTAKRRIAGLAGRDVDAHVVGGDRLERRLAPRRAPLLRRAAAPSRLLTLMTRMPRKRAGAQPCHTAFDLRRLALAVVERAAERPRRARRRSRRTSVQNSTLFAWYATSRSMRVILPLLISQNVWPPNWKL